MRRYRSSLAHRRCAKRTHCLSYSLGRSITTIVKVSSTPRLVSTGSNDWHICGCGCRTTTLFAYHIPNNYKYLFPSIWMRNRCLPSYFLMLTGCKWGYMGLIKGIVVESSLGKHTLLSWQPICAKTRKRTFSSGKNIPDWKEHGYKDPINDSSALQCGSINDKPLFDPMPLSWDLLHLSFFATKRDVYQTPRKTGQKKNVPERKFYS